MELIIAGVVLISAAWLLMSYHTKRTISNHSKRLAGITGRSATQIYNEMIQKSLTPGEWAERNGLDPISFKPKSDQGITSDDSRAGQDRAPAVPQSGQGSPSSYETPGVLERAASEDAVATRIAQTAMQSWYEDFEGLIRHAADKSGHLPEVSSVFVEAYATVGAIKSSVESGELPENTEGVFNEIRLTGKQEGDAGLSREWVVAFWTLRQHAALLAFRQYLGDSEALQETLNAWEAAREKLQDQ